MTQQQGIIVLVDVQNALKDRSLKGNAYLLDNMDLQGSENEGTGDLVTAAPGTHWIDGSQATEQVLNWLPYSLGAIPPTVPRNYQAERAQQSDRAALAELHALVGRPEQAGTDLSSELNRIRRTTGKKARSGRHAHSNVGPKVLDITGNVVSDSSALAQSYPSPVITDIYGEAVDSKVMYPAQYGSPDMVTDGWYWAASIDTSRPGTYAYTMKIELHELTEQDGEFVWEPVRLTCASRIKVTTEPRRNGFTKAGMGMLPIPPRTCA